MALENDDRTLTSEQALEIGQSGKIILIDVRREDEWVSTGLAPNAHAISMSDSNFIGKLEELTSNNKDHPVAVICAAEGRSARVAQALHQEGYNFVYDVAEGMVGGPFGSGWVNKNLPTIAYNAQ